MICPSISEKQQKTWSLRRNLGYPFVMLLLLMLTVSAATYLTHFLLAVHTLTKIVSISRVV